MNERESDAEKSNKGENIRGEGGREKPEDKQVENRFGVNVTGSRGKLLCIGIFMELDSISIQAIQC